MEILGIGPLELLLVVLLALIILGPKELQNAGKTLGRSLNKLIKSDLWKVFRQTSEKIKYLPNELMREAQMEEYKIAQENQPTEAATSVPPAGEEAAAEPPRIVPPAGVQPPAGEEKTIPPDADEQQHG
jgi:sec-independent protein translocase protein TatB